MKEAGSLLILVSSLVVACGEHQAEAIKPRNLFQEANIKQYGIALVNIQCVDTYVDCGDVALHCFRQALHLSVSQEHGTIGIREVFFSRLDKRKRRLTV